MKNIENDVIKLAWENEQLRNENARLREFLDTVQNCAIQMREDLEDYKKMVAQTDYIKKEQRIKQYQEFLMAHGIELNREKAYIKAFRFYNTPNEIAKTGSLFDIAF